ncbi:MAG: hypothetical protein M0Z38_09815 [Deltaproteobacteria bacterium]|nr:hypothetical protein [Deltaproteobacteria bacterium]
MEKTRTGYLVVFALSLVLLAAPGISAAAEMKGHGSMPGMKMEGHGDMKTGDHGKMMKMGDKIFDGKVGPWIGEARLIDMKAQMEKAKASGMKMEGTMKTHHFEIALTDAGTKKLVTEGKGSVTVTGPDKKSEKVGIMAMAGHFGVDVNLPKPGKYTFAVSIESGGKNGTAKFSHEVK